MNYAQPEMFAVLLLLLPLCVLWWQGARVYKKRLATVFPSLDKTYSGLPLLSWGLQIIGFALVVVALARPRWDFRWEEVRKKGSDLVVVLDVSRSMQANDLNPQRLSVAKRAIKDVLDAASGDRLALVLFSGAAFIQCPLTHDRESFALFLDQADSELIPIQGTALSEALEKAQRALDDGEEGQSQGRAILLLSDGEDHQGDIDEIAQELAKKSIRVHAVGVGGSGAPIPMSEGGFMRDNAGQVVVSRLNEEPLRVLAEKTGGTYRRLDQTLDFAAIYKNEIRAGNPEQESVSREKIWMERHMYASLLALFCFLVDGLWLRPWYRTHKKLVKMT